ncbi:unnamed protein product [[Candida] boidinii]|uniref:Unnamed protein product n=1 Tax=Candida boidinii TaxID=5477 RepID=A0A9W6T329_CANBO|nr:unnamed protein product [[Candida] boidinii]
MSTYWGLKASQTPKENLIPGTSKWIANEIYKSSGLVSSHVEQFSYSVIADLEWLDNQMKSILSAQERGSIDEFDESLYFLGSPTKTFTKLPKLSELQQQEPQELQEQEQEQEQQQQQQQQQGQGQGKGTGKIQQLQSKKGILQLQYEDENKENNNTNVELLPKKNSKRLNDRASQKTNKTNKLTSRNLNIKEPELNKNPSSLPNNNTENSKLQDEIKIHELFVSSTPFTKNISQLNKLCDHQDEDDNSSDTNITDLSFHALTANTRKSIAQKNLINQQQQQQQQQQQNDVANEKISDPINAINKLTSNEKLNNSNEINNKPYSSTPLIKDASGGNLNRESIDDEINTLFEKHMMSQTSRLDETVTKRDITESGKDITKVLMDENNNNNNHTDNNKNNNKNINDNIADESDDAQENDDNSLTSLADLDKNFSIDIGKLEKIEVSMIRLPLKSADAVSKHNTPTTKRSSITFTALPHREPLTLKSATRKSSRISIRGNGDSHDEKKTQSHNKDEHTMSKQDKISEKLDYNKENDLKTLLSPGSPVSSSEPTIKMRNYYTNNNRNNIAINDNIKKYNINDQNENMTEQQKQQYSNQNQKLDDIKEDSSFKGIFGTADKDVSIKETDNCDLSSNFERTINKTNLSTYNHSSQRNSLNEFEESPIKCC